MGFVAFGIFIVSCGLIHFMAAITLWEPMLWLAGGVKIAISARRDGDGMIEIAVRDHGLGIPTEHRRACSRKLPGAPDGVPERMGLGLYIARELGPGGQDLDRVP